MPTSLNKYLDPAALDETVVNIRELIEGLEEEMQELPYARPDGLYPDMTVGAVIGADETSQWARRESTGSGAATVRSVQGAAVGWNQLVNGTTRTVTATGVTYTFSNGKVALSGTPTDGNNFYINSVQDKFSVVQDHKYIALGSDRARNIMLQVTGIGTMWGDTVYTAISDRSEQMLLYFSASSDTDGYECYPQLFDLTTMFGSGNEPSTVAEFEAMFPLPYYPYSAPTLKPVQIAGIASTDAQGGELDAIEWTAQTLRAAGSVADMLYSDHVDLNVGVVDLGTLTWGMYSNYFYATVADKRGGLTADIPNALACARYQIEPVTVSSGNLRDGFISEQYGGTNRGLLIKDSNYTNAADLKASLAGVLCFYALAEPTTTPISPALPMTYRVQQGGAESIIVPDGEVSAAPVLTVAEPVNAGDEFARIWAAIQSLGYTRNTAQLSRPVSLTDIGSIDEVQKDTADIDTTKEVTE